MKLITDGQSFALNRLIDRWARGDRALRLHVISVLVGRVVQSSKALTAVEWGRIRDEAYPNWADEAIQEEARWAVDRAFGAKVQTIVEQYQEEVLG